MSGYKKMVTVYHDGEVTERETEMARCYNFDSEYVYIPKSQIEDEGDNTLTISEWLMNQKELEFYVV